MSIARSSTPCGVDKQLLKEEWYHGLLPREDIEMLLQKNGDFLVRSTEPQKGEKRSFVLSTMYKEENQTIKHFVIKEAENNKYMIEKMGFPSVSTMIQYHLKTKESIINAYEIVITTPIGQQEWEQNHDDVKLGKKLGTGAFGEVFMGTLDVPRGRDKGKVVEVAVKLAKLENLTKKQIKEIMSEARLMRRIDHPNVVRFYGVAAGMEPLMVIMELASKGALDSFLKKNANLTFPKLHEMVVQAGRGIEYLHSRGIIHRDIAARNCLYSHGKAKISDFGMSVEAEYYIHCDSSKVPYKWLAPETYGSGLFNQKTDVWSYGILAWEIYSKGMDPYPGMANSVVEQYIKSGHRMKFPSSVRPDIAKFFVKQVWAEESLRPMMAAVMRRLKSIKVTRQKDVSGALSVTRSASNGNLSINSRSNEIVGSASKENISINSKSKEIVPSASKEAISPNNLSKELARSASKENLFINNRSKEIVSTRPSKEALSLRPSNHLSTRRRSNDKSTEEKPSLLGSLAHTLKRGSKKENRGTKRDK